VSATDDYINGTGSYEAMRAEQSGGGSSVSSAPSQTTPQAQYVTNNKGQTTSQYTQGNTRYDVMPDSVFDPLSKNYNALVANSGGKITLADLDSSTASGLSANYNGAAGSGNTANVGGVTQGGVANYNSPQGGGYSGGSQPTNNTAFISQQNDTALQSTIASIKAAVQQAKAKQQTVIDKTAPEQYGNLKNIAYGQSIAALPGMRENSANLGASDQGGYSRTTETRANSEMQDRLGELDRQKQTVIDQANATIADLETQGMFNEANATKESALAKLQQIVAESSRLDTVNNQNYWNAQNYNLSAAGLTGTLDGQQTLAGKQSDANIAQSAAAAALSNAQIAEITNPNSITNQLAQIGLDTEKLNYSALPEQLKAQAQQIAQSLQQGQISIQTAQASLDYLPRQMEAELSQSAASTASANRANTSSGTKTPSVTELNYQNKQSSQQATAQAMEKLQEKANLGWTRDQVLDWMYSNSGSFISAGVDMDNLAKLASSAYQWNSDTESRYK
jgi:hypothetical protein